ncbi:hypothetical protein CONPUDRAFT_165648 [Coniophora puteana RWD-64-598 SS2]|uniref:Mismatched base pair and cruciform DNA recognition protein n=1 Tax=Coniophora puteana (strain RWD-64-598) TaxID=741705 RepID=A0A5M3MR43_CONPW|nr:uncharacterized protein CONPUDRAFT_165648 [Coniophora puteana RWD-64-598 SS2]EIW81536.1 hypothetical protein CONPUDRAFT_165648 [Coniophora puteana RWD-64-598 SS2]
MSSNSYTQPSKTNGQLRSMKGTAVEAVGNATGAQSWQKSGKDEHAEGEAEHKAAQAKGRAEGTKDRAMGYKDSVVGAVTGDKGQQASGESLVCAVTGLNGDGVLTGVFDGVGNARNEKGQAQQDMNKSS